MTKNEFIIAFSDRNIDISHPELSVIYGLDKFSEISGSADAKDIAEEVMKNAFLSKISQKTPTSKRSVGRG